MLRTLRTALDSRFGRRWAAVIVLATTVLLVANPELLSLMLLVNLIGVDVFVLLIGLQLQQQWWAIRAGVLVPVWGRARRWVRGS